MKIQLFLKSIKNLELVWTSVWSLLLITYYIFSEFKFPEITIFEYSLQIIFVMASLLSGFIFIIKNIVYVKLSSELKQSQNNRNDLADGARIVFSLVNIIYYLLDLLDNIFIKINYNYLWLILPWLLWFPIILELSDSVKEEFSWIK